MTCQPVPIAPDQWNVWRFDSGPEATSDDVIEWLEDAFAAVDGVEVHDVKLFLESNGRAPDAVRLWSRTTDCDPLPFLSDQGPGHVAWWARFVVRAEQEKPVPFPESESVLLQSAGAIPRADGPEVPEQPPGLLERVGDTVATHATGIAVGQLISALALAFIAYKVYVEPKGQRT